MRATFPAGAATETPGFEVVPNYPEARETGGGLKMPVSRRMMMRMALAPVALAEAQVADIPPTVSRIFPGEDGKLVYVPDEHGNTIPDFSYAGFD